MAVWPIYWAFTALFLIAGAFHGKWLAPLVVLMAFVLTRLAVLYAFEPELWVGLIWIIAAGLVAWVGQPNAGLAFLASGLCYPIFRLFNTKIELLGMLPITADVFAIIGLLLIVGGCLGPLIFDRENSASRDRVWVSGVSSNSLFQGNEKS